MFKIFRYFALSAFVSLCIAGTALVLFHRTVAVQELVELGEQSNLVPARTALNSVRPALVEYLESANARESAHGVPPPVPEILASRVRELMSGSSVVRIKIY
ncbi:MAG: hypothetical protein ACR2RL_09395, partial [Gammaproteobacteria bacterium]